jgi:hypothetical protein
MSDQISSEIDNNNKSSVIVSAESCTSASSVKQTNKKEDSNSNINKEDGSNEIQELKKPSIPARKSKSKKPKKNSFHPSTFAEPSPQVQLAFDFFTNLKSSDASFRWAVFIGILVTMRVVFIGLETVDGPNQYTDRENVSTYPFLPDAAGYYTFRLICMIPLYFDSFGRIVTILMIKNNDNNKIIFKQLDNDTIDWYLLFGDCVGPIASLLFFADAFQVGESQRVVIQLIDLLNCSRIIRLVKDISPIWTFRTALYRSGPHLLVPFFFFMLFNITMAVFFFFIQPCYNDSSCPWKDLFDVFIYLTINCLFYLSNYFYLTNSIYLFICRYHFML